MVSNQIPMIRNERNPIRDIRLLTNPFVHPNATASLQRTRNLRLVPSLPALAAIVCSVVGFAGCGPKTTDIVVSDAEPGPGPETMSDADRVGTPVLYDDRDWATVLRECVRDGRVDYDYLAAHRGPLDRHLALIGRCGPQSAPDAFPSSRNRVCYYANAFNAGVLAAVLHAGIPDENSSVSGGRILDQFRIRLDGQWRRLREVESIAVAESGDDGRVLFALCDAALGSPPLHDQALRPDGLEESLRMLARRAMDDPRVVSVDHARQELLAATWLVARQDRLMRSYERRTGAREATLLNVLLEYAGAARRDWLNTAVGYPVRMIPFDRRLNRKPADDTVD